ncbi:dihydroxyacetone kinase subunit DhaL [Streptomyces sp. B1I3]|uniref:dihydroxyacetone kinase subunit DhaL n=1 Tax=Streptomyces sp. B1I3 TaxID=3042264 RepID=UPI002782B3C5|nr:dihydroxyacetone kinase subunit DhaL [Streptomyces sp. B1I3]MDQ0794205.1 dihydroxyacetone kinase-like protein [Streptomyces sp. B1I3]
MLARDWLRAFARATYANKSHLTVLDSAIGDGDHGVNLCRGLSYVCRWLDEGDVPDSVGGVLSEVGALLLTRVGGASGVLYGSAFQAMGAELATTEADPHMFTDALDAGLAVIVKLGAAAPGDKTMVDAFVPALAAFRGSCVEISCLRRATSAAASAASAGAESTIPLLARKGRASYLGHRSIGYLDPGAVSTELLFRSLAEVVSSARACV